MADVAEIDEGPCRHEPCSSSQAADIEAAIAGDLPGALVTWWDLTIFAAAAGQGLYAMR